MKIAHKSDIEKSYMRITHKDNTQRYSNCILAKILYLRNSDWGTPVKALLSIYSSYISTKTLQLKHLSSDTSIKVLQSR